MGAVSNPAATPHPASAAPVTAVRMLGVTKRFGPVTACDRIDFELLSRAVSAVNGCGTCVASHERKVRAAGLGREAVQSAVRIAAVIHAAAVAHEYAQRGPAGLSKAA